MHPSQAIKTPFITTLAAAVLALQFFTLPASASPAPARLDDEVSRQLQTTAETDRIPVIVEGPEARVRNTGGHVIGSSSVLGTTVAELTPAEIRALSADPAVGRIHFDSPVRAAAVGADGSSTGSTPIVFQQTVGATDAWKTGNTGQDVTVAVLDTGIQDSSAFGARVKARVDLVDPAHPAQGDPAGHGTHVAGIVAASRTSPSPGVAPDAKLVSVRVLDDQGRGRLSTVIGGLEWTVAHRTQLGIRVIVLALGAPAVGSYRDDPLAAVTEIAWHSGIVVVVAAGNAGPAAGSVQTPGIDPLVLTAGATDEAGTPQTSDDSVPTWSAQGPTVDGQNKPDVVAPGRKIVSVRVPGSTLDRLLPTHIEGPSTFRLTGTSEAAAVAAGSVALVINQRPGLKPDEVKAIVVRSANHLGGASANAQGSGEISVTRSLAMATPRNARQNPRPGQALLRMLPVEILKQIFSEISNGDEDQQNADDLNGNHLNWDHLNWDHLNWDHLNWDHLNWDHLNWDHLNWDHLNWDHLNWDASQTLD